MTEQEIMLTSVLDCPRIDLYIRNVHLDSEQRERLAGMRRRRATGEPLQYILGEWSFMGLDFYVDRRALIPRPETEILVTMAIERLRQADCRHARILDVGTGSGNIAVSLAIQLPQSRISAIDISPSALDLCRENARRHGVADRVTCVTTDMKTFLCEPGGERETFDLIVSNPPYIPKSAVPQLAAEIQWEPRRALDGGGDGMRFHRLLLQGARRHLSPGGSMGFEIGDGQAEAVAEFARSTGDWATIEFTQDYAQQTRICWVR